MTPKISVLMPVHNGGAWLRAALDSILAQDFPDFELLAIDDASTDDSPQVLQAYAERESRMRVLHPPQRGLVAALNCGIAAARAPFLARLDADDCARPQRLGRQLRYLEAHPDIGVLGTWAETIDEGGTVIGRLTPETAPHKLKVLLARTNPFVHSSIMARADLVRRLGGYRAAFEAAEDHDLWLRMSEMAETANLPEFLTLYRWHRANVSQRKEIRAAFSVRLAQRSAAARRRTGKDPADGLAAPPDWRDAGADQAFYAPDARLYRLLAGADPAEPLAEADPSPLVERFGDLTHRERKLAQRAVLRLMGQQRDFRQTLRLLTLFVALHPGRAVLLAARALAGRQAEPGG